MSKYVVVDLEMCKIPRSVKTGDFRCSRELIEIGAVLLDESFEIIDTFKTYVSPQFGIVDTFIHNLTGISQYDTRDALSTEYALTAFAEWVPEDAVLVSWSENDEIQIRKEVEGKHIEIAKLDALLEHWVDCQKTFGEKMDNPKCYSLAEALILADIDYEDGAHDALVDAHNTALLFKKMETEEWQLNTYYTAKDSGINMSYNPFAEFFASYQCVG